MNEEEEVKYTKPIPLEELPETPAVLGEMRQEFEETKRNVEREIEVEGLGKGRLVISRQNDNKPFFYADEANVEANVKAAKQLSVAENIVNLPATVAPFVGIARGAKQIFNQNTMNRYKKLFMKVEESIGKDNYQPINVTPTPPGLTRTSEYKTPDDPYAGLSLIQKIRTGIDRSGITFPFKVMAGQGILDFTAGGSTNRPFTSPEEDKDLTRRYKEITNPDSRILDPLDEDYGKLKSEVLPERERSRQRDLILEAKGDNLLGMLSDDELQKVFPKSYRSFYNKLKPDKKGRFVDLRRKFDVQKIREMYPGDENEDFRRTVFALAADPRFSTTTFTKTRKNLIGEWLEGLDDIQERVFAETQNTKTLEAHHINSIRHVASLFDGFDFNERIILRNRLLENMFPVGNNPDNLILLNDKIHDEIHRQLDAQIGKFAEKFIDENKRYTMEEALDVAKRMGTVVNQITQEAYDSMADYMAQKFEEESPSARMAAEMSMNDVKPILEAVLDEYIDFANEKAEESMRTAMENLPQTQEGVLPVDLEDQPAPRPSQLTRGPGKKTIERRRMLEEKYGKQLEL
tara:strand:- start:5 stop:1729 length:1725 start_codon:yes stop_codon:yes gene_type:complete